MRKWTFIAAMLAVSGCSAGADKAAAEGASVRFHHLLEAGNYHEIYATAAPEFRRAGSEGEFTRFLAAVHDRLGPARQSQPQGWRVNLVPGGNVVTLAYDTRFTSGRGIETFVFRVNGNSARLVGYNINSTDLIAQPARPSATPRPEATR